ncbi:RAMP superfamily CRISPR-associated protein [uncultured Aliiroseovarius sp.]|uniref:RAMP superfamily CRISPR-associated protein n=1 Tax=uncultured Aliiroseovarius sp. TaxID=1658783 RepID=UPI00262FC183|nr:RAMP superfamily CRISPR-associated protein [uncultured Aliiroseovarius sp.]
MAVKSPFRFARINRWVHEPNWGHLATHDVPFSDGVSGKVVVFLRTITPTLLGGERRAATEEREGAVWPFKIGDDYAIPPSSMQGMCRSILEIACFGRLGDVIEDRKVTGRENRRKITHSKSSHELLEFSNPQHKQAAETASLDMASLIFGCAAEGNNGKGLKRRAWFGVGRATSRKPTSHFRNPAVLAEPKPSYEGIYVRQEGVGGRLNRGSDFATFSPQPGPNYRSQPELAGIKIWPSSYPDASPITLPRLPRKIAKNKLVQTALHPVPESTVFEIPLTFHNLRPVELGALLWTLTYGEIDALAADTTGVHRHHRLGMGKPYGLGEVSISVHLSCTDSEKSAMKFVNDFEAYMQESYNRANQGTWKDTVQVKALLKASDPEINKHQQLAYMPLGPKDLTEHHRDLGFTEQDTYQRAKTGKYFLEDYVEGGHEPKRAGGIENSAGRVTSHSSSSAAAIGGGRILFRRSDGNSYYHRVTEDSFELLEDAQVGENVRVRNMITGEEVQVRSEDLVVE